MRFKKLMSEVKDKFKFVFYCPKVNKIFLVEKQYKLMPNNTLYFCYADEEFFGLDKRITDKLTWQYLGML